jgi:hypothetical protein
VPSPGRAERLRYRFLLAEPPAPSPGGSHATGPRFPGSTSVPRCPSPGPLLRRRPSPFPVPRPSRASAGARGCVLSRRRCPQLWAVRTVPPAPVGGRSYRHRNGDRRRHIEKLSPDMCTGWGDLVCVGSPRVIGAGPDRRRLTGPHLVRDAVSASDLRRCPEPGRWSDRGRSQPSNSGSAPHTTWGQSGETQGTGGGWCGSSVHNRRDVHVSTTGRRSPPTVGQQGHSGTDQRKEARSPASTRVMTRMSYLSDESLNHSLGGDAPLGPVRTPARTHRHGAGAGPDVASGDGGFPPGVRTRHDDSARRARLRSGQRLGWVER